MDHFRCFFLALYLNLKFGKNNFLLFNLRRQMRFFEHPEIKPALYLNIKVIFSADQRGGAHPSVAGF